jgi:hypothetical protein
MCNSCAPEISTAGYRGACVLQRLQRLELIAVLAVGECLMGNPETPAGLRYVTALVVVIHPREARTRLTGQQWCRGKAHPPGQNIHSIHRPLSIPGNLLQFIDEQCIQATPLSHRCHCMKTGGHSGYNCPGSAGVRFGILVGSTSLKSLFPMWGVQPPAPLDSHGTSSQAVQWQQKARIRAR